MSFSMYAAAVPVFRQILTSLLDILDKAEQHVETKKIDPNALLQYRLFPDMLPFTRQIQIASDFAKGAGARLAGQDVPAWEDTEKTFADLKLRIKKTLTFLDSLPEQAFDDAATRAITTGSGEKTRHFTGHNYLLHYALPHFFFHATTAYDILRHNGLDIGKKDFIGVIPQ
ncbi:hypothetical protein IP92_03939 [Pseudoduganella flava]|uniref:DUF1993 family protein n=1 Tax=Pseudoduganella flava TaxID=871742 RepID=A0A562PK20_9BURK|nr:DUF1993 domain-containing protein [Pseudoduganella flava]QGZ42233.1 DUF1993 family protein [Pseudoduganella flava]TWI44769.1 hypothetical protein IP92_03939 [Pseudoduganella flava]